MEKKKGRQLFSLNKFEKEILGVIFLACSLPVFMVVGFFYFVFNDLVQSHLRTSLANQLLNHLLILMVIVLVYYFLFVGILAYRYVHKLMGAFPRILRELDRRIDGKTKAHLSVRKGDYIKDFIDRINLLLDKLP